MKDMNHNSDCAVHNPPAFPAEPCDCGAKIQECRSCIYWERSNLEDHEAPEGFCHAKNWKGPLWINGEKGVPTFAYHPNVLQGDWCSAFKRSRKR